MSENNQFEIVMQQRMEEFLVEPAPSDWQAIYDQLHPHKKRRIIWWWFPLVAILGAGIYWISVEKIGVKNVPTVAVSTVDNKNSAKESTASVSQPTKKIGEQNENGTTAKTSSSARQDNKNNTSTPSKKLTTRSTVGQQGKNQRPSRITNSKTPVNNNSAHSAIEKPAETSVNQQSVATSENNENAVPAGKTISDSITHTQKIDSGKSTVETDQKVKETTAIPVKNKDRNWRFAGYLGAGPNFSTDPVHLMQGGLMADVSSPNSSSGGSRTYTNSNDKGGWHFSAGIAAEKNLGKNWLFMAGLGINTSTWTVTTETYKDSSFSGSLNSTYKLSTVTNKNKLLMAEIPLQFSNRIAGKKSGSLWWTVGMNNQFRLKYSQQSTTDSISGASMADYRIMTSTARFYQPQFRLGLMYNHNGKVHWQLQSLFQYTLTGVYSAGGSDNPALANLQLQYRLFLQGKTKGKKSSK